MVRNRTGKDPVPTSEIYSRLVALLQGHLSSGLTTFHKSGDSTLRELRRLLHLPKLQGLTALRSTRRRRVLATALLAGGTTAAAALAIATVDQLHTPVAPLAAPRPVPTAAEAIAAAPLARIKHHRIADAFHGSLAELERIRDLHPLRGIASWYGSVWNGHKTASGETFDETQMTAAHRTLPLGTVVRVTDMRTERSVVVRINDRGTLGPGRVIDLSSAAAEALGILRTGVADVKLEVLRRPAQS